MAVSRRGFLKSGTMLAVAASIPAGLARTVLGKESNAALPGGFAFRKSDFEPCLNSQFRVHVGNAETVEMRLVKIIDLRRAVNKREREAFSLVFQSRSGVKLPQETYLFEHRQLGKLKLFTVPVEGKKRTVLHEVIVNRIK